MRETPGEDPATTTDQWAALFAGVQEDAKGAHAERTRKNYTSYVQQITRGILVFNDHLVRLRNSRSLRSSTAPLTVETLAS